MAHLAPSASVTVSRGCPGASSRPPDSVDHNEVLPSPCGKEAGLAASSHLHPPPLKSAPVTAHLPPPEGAAARPQGSGLALTARFTAPAGPLPAQHLHDDPADFAGQPACPRLPAVQTLPRLRVAPGSAARQVCGPCLPAVGDQVLAQQLRAPGAGACTIGRERQILGVQLRLFLVGTDSKPLEARKVNRLLAMEARTRTRTSCSGISTTHSSTSPSSRLPGVGRGKRAARGGVGGVPPAWSHRPSCPKLLPSPLRGPGDQKPPHPHPATVLIVI